MGSSNSCFSKVMLVLQGCNPYYLIDVRFIEGLSGRQTSNLVLTIGWLKTRLEVFQFPMLEVFCWLKIGQISGNYIGSKTAIHWTWGTNGFQCRWIFQKKKGAFGAFHLSQNFSNFFGENTSDMFIPIWSMYGIFTFTIFTVRNQPDQM